MVQIARAKCFPMLKTIPGASIDGVPHSLHLKFSTTTPSSPLPSSGSQRTKEVLRFSRGSTGWSHTLCPFQPLPGSCGLHDLEQQGIYPFWVPVFSSENQGDEYHLFKAACKTETLCMQGVYLEQCFSHSRYSVTETSRIMPMPSSKSVCSLSFSVPNEVKQEPKSHMGIFQGLSIPTPFWRHLQKSSSKPHLDESYIIFPEWKTSEYLTSFRLESSVVCFTGSSHTCFSPLTKTTNLQGQNLRTVDTGHSR